MKNLLKKAIQWKLSCKPKSWQHLLFWLCNASQGTAGHLLCQPTRCARIRKVVRKMMPLKRRSCRCGWWMREREELKMTWGLRWRRQEEEIGKHLYILKVRLRQWGRHWESNSLLSIQDFGSTNFWAGKRQSTDSLWPRKLNDAVPLCSS